LFSAAAMALLPCCRYDATSVALFKSEES
jgi:hypothetical protein